MSKGIRVLFTRYTMVSAHLSIIPEFLEKINIDDLMMNPKEYLTKVSKDFYNSEEENIKKAIEGGKNLAKKIIKGTK